MKATFPILLLLQCQWITLTFAQHDLEFEHLTRRDGLPDQSISEIMQDQQGFIWMGTSNGICRYDGYEFLTFTPEESGVAAGPVSGLLESADGHIWFCTRGGGVSRLDPRSGMVHTWNRRDSSGLINDYCNNIRELPGGSILVATDAGVFVSHPHAGTRTWVALPVPFSGNKTIMDAVLDPWGWYWLATGRKGLLRWHPDNDSLTHLMTSTHVEMPSDLLKSLELVQTGDQYELWVAGFRAVRRWTIDETGILDSQNPLAGLDATYRLLGLRNGENHTVWAYGLDGLIRIQPNGQEWQISTYAHNPELATSLPGGTIYTAFTDQQGVLWVGTENQGIGKSAIRTDEEYRETFHHTRLPLVGHASVQSVTALYEAESGLRLVGLEGGGLLVFNASGDLTQSWQESNRSRFSLPHSIVTCIQAASDSVFWIGTFGGLASIDLSSGTSTHWQHNPNQTNSLSDNHIFALCQSPGMLWVGTRGGGLNAFDWQQNQWHHFRYEEGEENGIPDDYVWNIVAESDSVLWLCTDGGLARMSLPRHSFQVWSHDPTDPGSLSHRFLNGVLPDRQGRIWVATAGGGLNLMLPPTANEPVRFKAFRIRDGLPSNYLYNLLEDDSGRIWISSTQGLSVFRPDDTGPGITNLRSYSSRHGLQGDEFNAGAFFAAPGGVILAGGLNGYNWFHPDSLPAMAPETNPTFTWVRLGGTILRPGPCEGRPCLIDGGPVPELTLTHREYMVEIGFSALDVIDAASQTYAYQLSGVDPSWVFAGHSHAATYTNLPPGRHELRVKTGANPSSEGTLVLVIDVLPPWWRTWWAFGIWALVLGAMIVGVIQVRIRQKLNKIEADNRILAAREEERKQLRKQTARDFHDELGNRMTRIALFSELIRRQSPPSEETRPFFEKMTQNVQALSSGMRDLIWVMDPGHDDLLSTLRRIVSFGEELFEHTGLRFSTDIAVDAQTPLSLSSKTRKNILLIFQEAMNNALKYASASEVSFVARKEQEAIVLEVSDDGIGFDPENVESGHGLTNMNVRAQEDHFQYQLRSKPGRGTTISLRLPLDSLS